MSPGLFLPRLWLMALLGCSSFQTLPTEAQTQPVTADSNAAQESLPGFSSDGELQARLGAWLPTDALLVGEQHDAIEHQALQARIVSALVSRGQLAALLLEMADSGRSTQGLPVSASEAEVRRALAWQDAAWPWASYGPAVMRAVRAGIPVLGANLPRTEMAVHMADNALDSRLPPPDWQAQQQAIRDGHCGLLPEGQMVPMARIQVGRDVRMAQVVTEAARAARPGQAVMLISGSAHADKALGVPRHVPAWLRVTAVRLQAGGGAFAGEQFDSVLTTPPVPAQDHCAKLRQQFAPRS